MTSDPPLQLQTLGKWGKAVGNTCVQLQHKKSKENNKHTTQTTRTARTTRNGRLLLLLPQVRLRFDEPTVYWLCMCCLSCVHRVQHTDNNNSNATQGNSSVSSTGALSTWLPPLLKSRFASVPTCRKRQRTRATRHSCTTPFLKWQTT